MSLIAYFPKDPKTADIPSHMESPFADYPHPLARHACLILQQELQQHAWQYEFFAADAGKMFGVLVVIDHTNRIGFLRAFSGMLAGRWEWPGFVPPVFDQRERDEYLPIAEAELDCYTEQIKALQQGDARAELQAQYDTLIQHYESELQALKATHRLRKIERERQRGELNSLITQACGESAIKKHLTLLSYASQQDRREQRAARERWSIKIASVAQRLNDIDGKVEELIKNRGNQSRVLHAKVFSTYMLANRPGEKQLITQFFADGQPPAGTGDCAAPKLLQYAHKHNLKPLAIAEFWWGAAPREGIRHHGHFYPACRSKCQPILPFMLKGLSVKPMPTTSEDIASGLVTVYEDNDLLVINKPSGLLSVPGKQIQDSVLTRLRQLYPDASGPLLVHRLDQATSGLLIAAKNATAHKAMQHQFQSRMIEKRYLAVLSKRLTEEASNGVIQNRGTIDLPLRVDIEDRPRQLVCFNHGKPATTHWKVIKRYQATTRIYFYPITGRTHQLRVHAAHQQGLSAAIVGDELYGDRGDRLLLHAERLRFRHPATGKLIEVLAPAPF